MFIDLKLRKYELLRSARTLIATAARNHAQRVSPNGSIYQAYYN